MIALNAQAGGKAKFRTRGGGGGWDGGEGEGGGDYAPGRLERVAIAACKQSLRAHGAKRGSICGGFMHCRTGSGGRPASEERAAPAAGLALATAALLSAFASPDAKACPRVTIVPYLAAARLRPP